MADNIYMETTSQILVSDLVEQVGSLPQVAAKVVTLASDPDCDIGKMAKVISCDNAMTLRFMALANSPSVSWGQEVKNLHSALVRLGLRQVRNLALLMGIHDMEPGDDNSCSGGKDEFWRYYLATASCARALEWLNPQSSTEENAWLAGILHGIGITAMQQKACTEFQQALTLAREEKIPLAAAEKQIFDFHHGDLGAGILQAWSLPPLFVETVRVCPEHTLPADLLPETPALVGVLQDAIMTVRAIGFAENGDGDPAPSIQELRSRLELADPALDALADKVDNHIIEISGLIGLGDSRDTFAAALEASRGTVAHLGLSGFDDNQARKTLESQLASACQIQQRLLPEECPPLEGFELAAANFPCHHVSGDTYDFVTLGDGSRAIVIADVSGKGLPAALLASTVQASIRALAPLFDDPGKLLAAANKALFQTTDDGKFTTLFLAAVDPDGQSIRYASAGHNPPLLLRADGQVEWLDPAGTPLGIMPEMEYPVMTVSLADGDLLVAYTDGITEAIDGEEEEFGETGLEQMVRAMAMRPLPRIIDFVIAAVHAHVEGLEQASPTDELLNLDRTGGISHDVGDDLTLVLLRKSP